jgi:hypothetical protein
MYFFEEHLHGLEKAGPTEPPDFCNNIGPLLPQCPALHVRSWKKGNMRAPNKYAACDPQWSWHWSIV